MFFRHRFKVFGFNQWLKIIIIILFYYYHELLVCFVGEKLKEAMTSVANFLIDPKSKVKDRSGKVPIYEHSGVHMVLRKIIGYDKILAQNNEGMTHFIIKFKKIYI